MSKPQKKAPMNRLTLLLMFSVLLGTAFAAPLSCQIRGGLAESVSVLRDQGRSRKDVEKILREAGDLTREELRALLNFVYTPALRNISPSKMGEIAFDVCKSASR